MCFLNVNPEEKMFVLLILVLFLFSERIVTTEKTVTEGPVTTKTGEYLDYINLNSITNIKSFNNNKFFSVTRVSSQQISGKKPLSPFAKFRQLDKQNSLNTPPR